MDTRDWVGLRSLDQAARRPKGDAFRAFKKLESTFSEGRDFLVLDHVHDAEQIAQLKLEQKTYSTSVQVILLSPAAAQAILQVLMRSGEV